MKIQQLDIEKQQLQSLIGHQTSELRESQKYSEYLLINQESQERQHLIEQIRLKQENDSLQKIISSLKNEQQFNAVKQNFDSDIKLCKLECHLKEVMIQHQADRQQWFSESQEKLTNLKIIQEQEKQNLTLRIKTISTKREEILIQLQESNALNEKIQQAHFKSQQHNNSEVKRLYTKLQQGEILSKIDSRLELEIKQDLQNKQVEQQKTKLQEQNQCLKEQIKSQQLVIEKQRLEIQQQCKLFDNFRSQFGKKIYQERSKSQYTLKVAQGLKSEYDKKYCILMDEILKTGKGTNRTLVMNSLNQSFSEILKASANEGLYNQMTSLQNLNMTYLFDRNELSHISHVQNVKEKVDENSFKQQSICIPSKTSVLNKVLFDLKDDELQRSSYLNISNNTLQVSSMRKKSRSEWDGLFLNLDQRKIIQNKSYRPIRDQMFISQDDKINMKSPKINQNKNKSSMQNIGKSLRVSKVTKQYTFNLCDLGRLPSQGTKNEDTIYSQNPEFTQSTQQISIDQNKNVNLNPMLIYQKPVQQRLKQSNIQKASNGLIASNGSKHSKSTIIKSPNKFNQQENRPSTSKKTINNLTQQKSHTKNYSSLCNEQEQGNKVAEEDVNINQVGMRIKFELMQNKEERLKTTTRFNSLLNVI